MIRNKVYFAAKPFVPVAIRRAIRRQFALRIRDRVKDVWPIIPGSERVPDGWPGWPDGKKFAVVLTHDVEGQVGLDKCRLLMEIELALGFHSSFNLIPEGDYAVPTELRQELVRNGFEVGIHDLKHDGRLFASRREFSKKASRINQYVDKWKCSGFRSGFMLHQLDWLHELDIHYDASTFDTDPFEPQPEGRQTIFPFWVGAPKAQRSASGFVEPTARRAVSDQRSEIRSADGRIRRGENQRSDPSSDLGPLTSAASAGGYVELPYTLPQDSTLFLLLGEKTTSIWEEKLEWIAHHGGMVLMIAHPDYMAFTDRVDQKAGQYPIEFYIRFLEHIHSKYSGKYWQALPRDVAAFCGQKNGTQTGWPAEKQIWHSLSAST